MNKKLFTATTRTGGVRAPAGMREQMSVLVLAGAVGSWLSPHAELASPGAGEVVNIAAVLIIPMTATLIRNALDATIGSKISGWVR